jgi:signal transduction histidine kinase
VNGQSGFAVRSPERFRYRRRLAAFFIVVAAAGGFFILFAWREADRDRLVWEKEQTKRLEQAAGLIADKLLSSLEDGLARLSRQHQASGLRADNLAVDDQALYREVFFIQPDGNVAFPLFRAPYRLGRAGPAPGLFETVQRNPDFFDAERLEFTGNNLAGAVLGYRRALASAASRSERGRILNALARAMTKAGRLEEALGAYGDLARDYGAELSEGGVPLGLVSAFAAARILASAERFPAAAERLLRLHEGLTGGEYALDKSQFVSFADLAEIRFAEIIGRVGTADVRQALLGRHERLLEIRRAAFDRAERADLILGEPDALASDTGHFVSLSVPSGPCLIGSVPVSSGGAFGAVFNDTRISEYVLPAVAGSLGLSRDFQVDLSAGFSESSPSGGAKKQGPVEGILSLERALAPGLAPWTLRIRWDPKAETLMRVGSKRFVYVSGAVVLIAAVVIGGLVTIRGISREMQLARLKTDFVATVSHELRTPLTSIRYIAELLKDGRAGEDERKARYYATLYQESERLSRIIENILDFSKMDAGLKQYRFSRVDAGPFTAEIAERFREAVSPKGWALEAALPAGLPVLWIDPEALGRALFNLLDNAVKYSGESRRVELEAASDDREFCWKVTDHGLGILEGDRSRIFDRFYRGSHESGPEIKGSGIGLAIAKHIVESHGGTISVDSEVGQGSTFTIAIPLAMDEVDAALRSERTR